MDEVEVVSPEVPTDDDQPLETPIMGDEAEVGEAADEDGPKDGELPSDAL